MGDDSHLILDVTNHFCVITKSLWRRFGETSPRYRVNPRSGSENVMDYLCVIA
ncbi:MAG: hypothetical protein LH702_21575 [Phormidesmis sp. CAN_BIN44]|nr:hypothetical protein [Phormidesmis sp. CAN_BIN44]